MKSPTFPNNRHTFRNSGISGGILSGIFKRVHICTLFIIKGSAIRYYIEVAAKRGSFPYLHMRKDREPKAYTHNTKSDVSPSFTCADTLCEAPSAYNAPTLPTDAATAVVGTSITIKLKKNTDRMAPHKDPMVTASIVVHQSPAEQLRKALMLLHADRVDKIWIIDNSPKDTLSAVAKEFPECIYKYVENRGFGAGHNIAIKEAARLGSDYHLVMNSDVSWEGSVIGAMTEFMEKNKDVALVGPKVYYPDGALQYSCRMLPTPADLLLKRFVPLCLIKKKMDSYLLAFANHDLPFECHYLPGSFLFMRTSDLIEAGGFDEQFFMYAEDIDLSRRLAQKKRVLYWPKVSIVHEHAAASRHSLKMLRIHMVSLAKYFNKWGWLFDSKRNQLNRNMLRNTPRAPYPRPRGRG